jgi:hypothetical protein
LLTQSVTNNFASRSVKKGVSGFVGLFKNKEEPSEEEISEEQPTIKKEEPSLIENENPLTIENN